ncbi:MAG TPA: hypothetical protein VMR17_06180 [Xanthobacteraceae bacterium]|jgi:maltose-binding protein MalE|nr:hypothetical protein [Xanthobacteraceae bacterium]
MALALLGYFGTMVTALAVLMTLLSGVLTSYPVAKKPQPYPVPVMAQIAQPDSSDAGKTPGRWGPAIVHKAPDDASAASSGAADAQLAAAKQAAADKAKQLKLARDQKRKDEMARAPDPQEFSTALGYGQEPPQQPSYGSPFNPFGPRRF